ncbi:MAG: Hcp family type VI secretion system effector [Nitrosopumilaceae archaeon]
MTQKNTILATLTSVLVLTIFMTTATPKADAAAADYFLKIEGIEGESIDRAHGGQLEVESWSFGASQTSSTSTGGAGTGKVSMQDFHFTKRVDKSSPKLAEALLSGEHIPSIELFVRKAGDTPLEYMKVKLSDCLISGYSVSGGSTAGEDKPVESISFNFSKIEFEYTEQKADGSAGATTRMGWDLALNKKV